jgi:hypothetical protein
MPAEPLAPSLEQLLDLAIASTSIAMLPFTVGALVALAWVRSSEGADPASVRGRD